MLDVQEVDLKEAAELSYKFMPEGEPVENKTYRFDGWFYLDLPGKFKIKTWESMLNEMGEDSKDYTILAMTLGYDDEGEWVRGQLLVSPEAMLRLASFSKKQ